MIFKGIAFRQSNRIVDLPNFNYLTGERYPHSIPGREAYTMFGRILPLGKTSPTAVKTEYKNRETGEWYYAEPIACDGHSLTNMMYGTDGRVYLAKNGKFYSAVLQK